MVEIIDYTTKEPITMIGRMAGICWNSNTSDDDINYKRGFNCIKSNHGRTLELPDVYIKLEGYSARVIRELYTHIGGLPTRLQESTRYVDYKDFDYVMPDSVKNNQNHELGSTTAKEYYNDLMKNISNTADELERLNVPREDIALVLPLGMKTKMVGKYNLRTLIDMSRQRMCKRAYHEFRSLMDDICTALSKYSYEWKVIIEETMMSKCDALGYCPEEKGCGKYPNKKR